MITKTGSFLQNVGPMAMLRSGLKVPAALLSKLYFRKNAKGFGLTKDKLDAIDWLSNQTMKRNAGIFLGNAAGAGALAGAGVYGYKKLKAREQGQ